MNIQHIREIISRLNTVNVLVIGDFFLDQYLDIDRCLEETSIETGLPAHQVTGVRNNPGAAGNVATNLASLGVNTCALTVLGEDGNGYELLSQLQNHAIDTQAVISASSRVTPTYTKPMMHEPDGTTHELSRLDIKNRSEMPPAVQQEIVNRLASLIDDVDGVIVADQVEEPNHGVLTELVRTNLIEMAGRYPQKIVVADSRCRISQYLGISIKPNDREASAAMGMQSVALNDEQALDTGIRLNRLISKPVYLTRGSAGIDVFAEGIRHQVPAVRVKGPIDTVGAGDSTLAGLTAALCARAMPEEAALIGCLTSSVTVRCLGTTGTATRQDVDEALNLWVEQQTRGK